MPLRHLADPQVLFLPPLPAEVLPKFLVEWKHCDIKYKLSGYQVWAVEERFIARGKDLPVVIMRTGDDTDVVYLEGWKCADRSHFSHAILELQTSGAHFEALRPGSEKEFLPIWTSSITEYTTMVPLPHRLDVCAPLLYASINMRQLGFIRNRKLKLILQPKDLRTFLSLIHSDLDPSAVGSYFPIYHMFKTMQWALLFFGFGKIEEPDGLLCNETLSALREFLGAFKNWHDFRMPDRHGIRRGIETIPHVFFLFACVLQVQSILVLIGIPHVPRDVFAAPDKFMDALAVAARRLRVRESRIITPSLFQYIQHYHENHRTRSKLASGHAVSRAIRSRFETSTTYVFRECAELSLTDTDSWIVVFREGHLSEQLALIFHGTAPFMYNGKPLETLAKYTENANSPSEAAANRLYARKRQPPVMTQTSEPRRVIGDRLTTTALSRLPDATGNESTAPPSVTSVADSDTKQQRSLFHAKYLRPRRDRRKDILPSQQQTDAEDDWLEASSLAPVQIDPLKKHQRPGSTNGLWFLNSLSPQRQITRTTSAQNLIGEVSHEEREEQTASESVLNLPLPRRRHSIQTLADPHVPEPSLKFDAHTLALEMQLLCKHRQLLSKIKFQKCIIDAQGDILEHYRRKTEHAASLTAQNAGTLNVKAMRAAEIIQSTNTFSRDASRSPLTLLDMGGQRLVYGQRLLDDKLAELSTLRSSLWDSVKQSENLSFDNEQNDMSWLPGFVRSFYEI